MPRIHYPETLAVRLRAGTLARIDAVADADDTSPAEWSRQAIRRALESAERQARRRKAAAA